MRTDQSAALITRAGIHAALGDPARLAVVEALRLGDASPSELQSVVNLPSNLLAHHLAVLQRVGLVTRMRSEGDRRRTYLRLVPAALDQLVPESLAAPRVVFVCTHNSARSQLAVALWSRRSGVPVASAGTHPAPQVHPGALAAAQRHGLSLGRSVPRALPDVARTDDFLVTVCDAAHEELGATGRLHWSIPDPVRVGSDEAFDQAFDQLTRRVDDLALRLTTPAPADHHRSTP
ncbi:helix-turn-helix domain-containing protein [Pengzhenrongella frigida]|uniref:ArsR family transcriptional regulator n=1 Tax=Pengzhenrongella frigida TaxID=1259133 RepID=A0A4V1ZH12_9MICO|nr:helix-turn-helix domain-containing protein [Cellulomonas sp. HLT2-17]RYV50434.1 ArsR family transcriptional regulator [Cellulomonas sp. HLT2-17]